MGFEKVIGYESIVLELKRTCDILKRVDEYKKLGVKPPSGILLRGKPGVGKTLLATSFIEECGVPYYICRKDKSNGDFLNSIKEKYEEACKNAPAIVLLDDLDKFANEDVEHKNAEEYVMVQTCIDSYKDKGVFTLATANDIYCLPDSLLRAGRFDKVINIMAPRGKCAEKIIEHFVANKPVLNNLDIKMVAKLLDGGSCAELETIINEAGIIATFENKKQIEMMDIVKAFLKIDYNIPESLDDTALAHKDKIAYHEAGHVVINEVLEPESVILVTVANENSDIEGITIEYNNPEFKVDAKYKEQCIIAFLGGKASTEMVYGSLDMGSVYDIDKAHRMVRDLICYNAKYGFFNGVDEYSSLDMMGRSMNQLVSSELQRYYQKAKKILYANREFLDKVASQLMEKEILLQGDIKKIKDTCNIKY